MLTENKKKTFWDWTAGIYDFFEIFSQPYRQMLHKVYELIPEGTSVLELAGGTGNISITVSKKAGSILCTDISNNMLKVANRKSKNLKNIAFAIEDIYNISQTDNSFDIVIASQVLHLLAKPEKACTQIKRVAKTMAILPIPLTKQTTIIGNFLLGLYKLFGYKASQELTLETCKKFVEKIWFNDCKFHLINGSVPICVAVWSKK